jgi:hypothetical protein
VAEAVSVTGGSPNTGNTNNFYNVTASGTGNNNNNASNALGVLCGFPPKRLPNGRTVTLSTG